MRGMEAGANDFLTKPILHHELRRAVRRLLIAFEPEIPPPPGYQPWEDFIGQRLSPDEKGFVRLPGEDDWHGQFRPAREVYYPPRS